MAEAAAGKSWIGAGRAVQSLQGTNLTTDDIRKWKVDLSAMEAGNIESALLAKGSYTTGQLVSQRVTDENGNQSWSYTNGLGQTILTRSELGDGTFAQTYYAYDVFGNLTFVLPPEAAQLLSENSWDPQFAGNASLQGKFQDLIFYYRYNDRKQPIAKKIPAQAGEVRMVYDRLGRLILSQDSRQRAGNEWSYSQYDILNRPVATGICILNESHSQLMSLLENTVENESLNLSIYEYDWNAFPYGTATEIEQLSVSYYDSYRAVDPNKHGFQSVPEFSWVAGSNAPNQDNRINGQLTASRVKVLDGSNAWLWTVTHYDRKGRVIQTVGDNHLGGQDVISTLFDDFNSRVLKTKLSHMANGQTQEIVKRFDYDHAGRVLASYYKLNGQPNEQLLARFEYNELGEMISKILGDNLQKIDYAYNIRGWLTKINDLDLLETNTEVKEDLWAMELSYDNGFDKNQYNGNVSGAKWRSKRDGKIHAYGYQYDKLNRLTQADYRYDAEGIGAWSNTEMDFTIFGIDYDLNGNILKLNRQGAIGKTAEGDWIYGGMDRLEYDYEGNRLIAVDDKAASDASAGDFMDIDQLYCSTAQTPILDDEYKYDENGNLTSDANKNLNAISYNHLNLPTEVQTDEGLVKYVYDAAGIKLRKEVYNPDNSLKSSMDYVGEFVYNQNGIEFIHHDEGRFLPAGNGDFKSEYHYKDHLGNLRLSFREEKAEYMLTMEDSVKDEEAEYFDNLEDTRYIVGVADAHGGTAVASVSGADANRTMGPATVMQASKGDKIKLTVFSKYLLSNFDATLTTQPNIGIAGSGGFEGGAGVFSNGGSGLTLTPLFNQFVKGQPMAYARIVIVDESGNELQEEYQLISNTANVYNSLTVALEVEQDGYAVVYLANESQMDVYFDDLALTHERLTWQENSYYPFGMAIKPLDKEGYPDHRFTYNGKEFQEEIGWSDYGARMYDAQIGRWNGVDPLAENYLVVSPYIYTLNNPILFVDPDGQQVDVSAILSSKDGVYALINIISDLSTITGQNIGFANGKLVNNGNDDEIEGSSFARDYLNKLIDDESVISINLDNSLSSSGKATPKGKISLSTNNIDTYINSVGQTAGFGMTFLHESLHTSLGASEMGALLEKKGLDTKYQKDERGVYSDEPISNETGDVVSLVNIFRDQLKWNQRDSHGKTEYEYKGSTYYSVEFGGEEILLEPMSSEDKKRRRLNSGQEFAKIRAAQIKSKKKKKKKN